MLPETSADHSLTLYRCTQFPDKWEKVQAFSVGARTVRQHYCG